MKIYHNQLTATLAQSVKPVWLIFGDEPWQKDNSLTTIKAHAKQQGYSELIRFSGDSKFDWQQLMDEYQSMSLFASQRIIEVEFTSNKIGDVGNKALLALSQRLLADAKSSQYPQEVLFIFHGEKLDAAGANRKWFKNLTQLGCYLPIYDLDAKALPNWLQSQARNLQVNLSTELSLLLLELFEGNLPALWQELQKLALLFAPNQQINLGDAEQLMINQAKFNAFQIADALLQGNAKKCITMLNAMQQEGLGSGQIIWVLHKEIRQLYDMLNKHHEGVPLTDIYKEYRIWDKRKPLYQQALQQVSLANVKRALSRLAEIDLLTKSQSEFDDFILLADLCLTLYHGETTQHFPLNYEYS